MRALSIAIVGITYPNKARGPTRLFELALCVPGERVDLVPKPKPKNEHDEHAIAVFSARGVQLGYLASERAVLIGSIMRHGIEVRAIFQALAETVRYCRVAFDEDPVLPSFAKQPTVEADGFYPDPYGSEWGA